MQFCGDGKGISLDKINEITNKAWSSNKIFFHAEKAKKQNDFLNGLVAFITLITY